tara:strand:+ start:207 stop:638 length:432 start_codon:yes stop_codon:yes gene_type:complete
MSGDKITHLFLELQNNLLNHSLKNDWSKNNGSLFTNITLLNNSVETSDYLDVDGFEATLGSKVRSILIFGKCNMTNETDSFSLVYTNGGSNQIFGEAIRPSLNAIDGMYHYKFEITTFTRAINIGNKCGTDITNFSLNYTYLK